MSRTLIAAVLTAAATCVPAAEHAGVVKIVRGEVTIERSGARLPAAAGDHVQAGDRIVTGADGRIGIALRDDTLLSAGPNASLGLDRFAFDSTTHAGGIDAALARGTLAVTSGKIAREAPESVRFRTRNAVLGVRGTRFLIDAGSGER